MQTEVIVAIITSSGSVFAAIVAGGAVLFAAKRVVDRKKLRLALVQALKDIQFLTEVEKAHVEINIGSNEKCNKVMVRDIVRREKGIDISGKNTLSTIRKRLAQLSSYDD